MSVITLGGLSGGGARLLGPMVAEKLGADYVDRLILTDVARQVGATVEALHQREERPPTRGERFSRVLQRILERSAVTGAGGDPYFGPGIAAFLTEEYENLPRPTITRGHELEDQPYIDALRKVMRELAAAGDVIFVGRGAHIILKDVPNVLRVGVIAGMEDRVIRIMERERLDRAQAEKTVMERDEAREYYFKRYFDIDSPDNSEYYQIMINTSQVSLEYGTEMVVDALRALVEGRFARKLEVVTG